MRIGMCMQDASSNRFRDNVVSVWNTAIGAVCLVLMTAILSVFAWRVVQARQQKKSWCVRHRLLLTGTGSVLCCPYASDIWKPQAVSRPNIHACVIYQILTCLAVFRKTRRKRNATLFFIEGTVQWLNLVFWVAPNIYLLVKPCYYLANVIFWCGWVRWTCWNTVSLCHDCLVLWCTYPRCCACYACHACHFALITSICRHCNLSQSVIFPSV